LASRFPFTFTIAKSSIAAANGAIIVSEGNSGTVAVAVGLGKYAGAELDEGVGVSVDLGENVGEEAGIGAEEGLELKTRFPSVLK